MKYKFLLCLVITSVLLASLIQAHSPNICNFSDTLGCADFWIMSNGNTTELQVVLRNNQGEEIDDLKLFVRIVGEKYWYECYVKETIIGPGNLTEASCTNIPTRWQQGSKVNLQTYVQHSSKAFKGSVFSILDGEPIIISTEDSDYWLFAKVKEFVRSHFSKPESLK